MDLEEGDHKSTSDTHGRSDPGKCCRCTRLQFLTGRSGRIQREVALSRDMKKEGRNHTGLEEECCGPGRWRGGSLAGEECFHLGRVLFPGLCQNLSGGVEKNLEYVCRF